MVVTQYQFALTYSTTNWLNLTVSKLPIGVKFALHASGKISGLLFGSTYSVITLVVPAGGRFSSESNVGSDKSKKCVE